jgi:hypothetical protein
MNAGFRRKRIRVAVLVALALPLVAGGQDAGEVEPSERPVSILALLVNPDAFDGREITLVGYVALDFDEQAIWPTAADGENVVLANAVWIGGPRITSLSANGYAEVKGVFKKHTSPYRAGVGKIMPEYVRPWRLARSAKPAPAQGCSWFL